MPRIIRTVCNPVPLDGLLVPSAYLRNDIAAAGLIREARRRVKDMLDEAREDAARIRRDGHDEGYLAGFSVMVEAVARHLDHHARLAASIWTSLEGEMRKVLQACIEDPDVIMAALEQALTRRIQPAAGQPGVEVLLPTSWRGAHGEWSARFEALVARFDGKLSIGYWEQPRIVARCSEHVVELAASDFVERALEGQRHFLDALAVEGAEITGRCRQLILAAFDTAHRVPDAAAPDMREAQR